MDTDLDRALAVFLAERTRLLQIAFRVTRSRAEAEEVVQEVWLRWQGTDRRGIRNPAAFLNTATTHLAINVVQSARVRHAADPVSPLGESVDPTDGPIALAERVETLEESLLTVVARLGPAERAAYVLRKAFDYPYSRIAEILHITAAHARQLVRRAQVKLERGRVLTVDRTAHRRLVEGFLVAARTGRMDAVETVLVEDVEKRATCAAGTRAARTGPVVVCRS